MPRKVLARRKPIPEVPIECRTKDRHDPPSCPPSPPPVKPTISSPNPSYHCFDKQIAPGRKLSFEFLREESFSIGDNLQRMSFQTIYCLDVPIYPNIVKEFYGILSRVFDDFISTV